MVPRLKLELLSSGIGICPLTKIQGYSTFLSALPSNSFPVCPKARPFIKKKKKKKKCKIEA
jgi:hypothetical protein